MRSAAPSNGKLFDVPEQASERVWRARRASSGCMILLLNRVVGLDVAAGFLAKLLENLVLGLEREGHLE